jgi:hypothetical protein
LLLIKKLHYYIAGMKQRFVDAIRQKSRQEWRAEVFDRWTTFRIWVQEHGEKAAGLGLIAGVALVLAFKLFVFLFILALLAGYVVYFVALEEGESPESKSQVEEAGAPRNNP